jgi:autophagy-related protein 5
MQVPRHTYLPLLIPEIKENMVELALDDSILSGLYEKDWWFEEEPPSAEEGEVFAGQGVCKWYVPLPILKPPLLSPIHFEMYKKGGRS